MPEPTMAMRTGRPPVVGPSKPFGGSTEAIAQPDGARRLVGRVSPVGPGHHGDMSPRDPSPPTFRTITVGLEGRIGRLTLDQPDRLNPIGSVALRELAEAAAWFDAKDAVLVVVSGAGRAFSS